MTPSTLSLDTSPLGKVVCHANQYDPKLLFVLAREPKRAEIGINGTLPFMGADLWNAYELSWLNARGKPQIALAHFIIPADSPNLIESKSFKLYLNSFNQMRLDSSVTLRQILLTDLSKAAGVSVEVELTLGEDFNNQDFSEMSGLLLDRLDITVDHYTPEVTFLSTDTTRGPIAETLVSHLLKSNCLITGQPDWGSVQIHYEGAPINQEGLLRYLISFRNHNEFHEQCVERIFFDILKHCNPQRLMVYARYTRRGGLDINPWRSNFSVRSPVNVRHARQ